MSRTPGETRQAKAIAIARSSGLDVNYEVDYGFEDDSLKTFNPGEVATSSLSNNVRVESNKFSVNSRSVSNSLGDTRVSRSTLLDNRAAGTGALQDPTAKFSRKKEIANATTATSGIVSSNTATVPPGQITGLKGAGSNLQKVSVEDVMSSTTPPDVERVPPGTTSVIKNQLREFASYNCIFTLGVLTAESVTDPVGTYRKNGPDFTILKSGGIGSAKRKVTTAFDDTAPGNLEYFIDNFNMTSIMSPNSKTGAALGSRLSFQVSEPYSMGVFLQSLKIASEAAHYQNYTRAAYLLEIDFIGWDTNGNSRPVNYASRKIPIRITNIEFNVEAGGSVYEVEAIVWNHQTLSDVTQEIHEPISIKGSNVANVLSFGAQSLSAVINSRAREFADRSEDEATDLYVIRFPKSRTTLGVAGGEDTSPAGPTVSEEDSEASNVVRTEQFVDRIDSFFGSSSSGSNNNIYQTLTGNSTTDVNNIGQSLMFDDFNQGTNHPFPLGIDTYDQEGDVYRRGSIELTIENGERVFTFPQGMPVVKIIEEIVLLSNYASANINQVDAEGMITWFIVEPECHLINSPRHEKATGDKPKVYVYNVVPYRVHSSTMSPPSKGVTGAQNLMRQVSKEYDYIYSGSNDDVLGFDIRFNTAFFEALRADYGSYSGSTVDGNKSQRIDLGGQKEYVRDTEPGDLSEVLFNNRRTWSVGNYIGGADFTDPKRNLAKQFHSMLLNSSADLLTASLEIWGDPYFLPDSGMGNYSASNSGQTATITTDGTIDYQRNECDILLNFRTPVDYKNNGEMEFQGETTELISGFSGFYLVTQIETVISGNKFTQTLELVRRKNQSTEGINTSRVVKESPGQHVEQPAGIAGVGTGNNTPGPDPRPPG